MSDTERKQVGSCLPWIFAERHKSFNSAVINDGVVTLDVESKSSPIISSVSLLTNILIRNYTNLNTIDEYRSTRT